MRFKKILRTVTITLVTLLGVYLLLLAGAAFYINRQKEHLRRKIETALRDNLHGQLSLKDFDVTFWRYFPSVGLRVTDFSLSDSVYHKPLFSVKTIATTFNPFSLLLSGKQIDDIIIEDAGFHLFTDSGGYSNKYLLTPRQRESGKRTVSSDLLLKKIRIGNLTMLIEDPRKNKRISLLVNKLDASIERNDSLMRISLQEDISMRQGLGFNLQKGSYFENQRISGDWVFNLGRRTQQLSFEKTTISVGGHPFGIAGNFRLGAKPEFSLQFSTRNIGFPLIQAIVTKHIRDKLGNVDISGVLDADGMVEGSLLPGVKPYVAINYRAGNNTLRTHMAAFTNCSFNGNFVNRVNADSVNDDANSRIRISDFTGNWSGIRLSGKQVVLTNLADPSLQFDLQSACTLQALDELFAMKQIRFLDGAAKIRLQYNGKVTKDRSMLEEIEGKLSISDGVVEYVSKGFMFSRCNGVVEFYKDSISIPGFRCSYLKNDIQVRMNGSNIRRAYLVGDRSRPPVLNCILQSGYLNLADFTPLFAGRKQRAKTPGSRQGLDLFSRKFDAMIANGIFRLAVTVNDIRHQNLQAKNFRGDIRFGNGYWDISALSMNFSEGRIRLSGSMVEQAGDRHEAGIRLSMDNVDVRKLFLAFDDFGLKDISHRHLQGSFSTSASMQAVITGKGSLASPGLRGTIDFSLRNGALFNFATLMHIKEYVFKKRNLEDVRFAEIKTRIDLNGEEMYINRMEISSNVFRLFLEGNYGLKGKNTDLLIQVPFSNFNKGNFDGETVPSNRGIGKAPKNIWLRAKNKDAGNVKLTLTLNPTLKTAKKGRRAT